MFFDARYAKYDISEHLLLFVNSWLFSPKKGEKHIFTQKWLVRLLLMPSYLVPIATASH